MMNLVEDEDKRTKFIETYIKKHFLDEYNEVLCDIRLEKNIIAGETTFDVTLIFIGGYGTKYYPRTQAVNNMYDEIMGEVWGFIYSNFNVTSQLYKKYVEEC